MAGLKTRKWDAAEHLNDDADVAAYVEAALEDGDPHVIAAVLGDVARAKGMTKVARDAGLGRESLYKSLSPTGNPELATVLRVMKALGIRLRATVLDDGRSADWHGQLPTGGATMLADEGEKFGE